MDNVVDGMVIAALVSALFYIFGFVLVIYPKWLQENCAARFYYGCIQIVVSMIVLSLGGWIVPYAAYEVISREHGPSYKTVKKASPTAYYGRAVTERQRGFTNKNNCRII